MDWTRVGGFGTNSGEFALAVNEVASMDAQSVVILANGAAEHRSVWHVITAGLAYIYFSPGASDALQHLLPPSWTYDPCVAPTGVAVMLRGHDGDARHFGLLGA